MWERFVDDGDDHVAVAVGVVFAALEEPDEGVPFGVASDNHG